MPFSLSACRLTQRRRTRSSRGFSLVELTVSVAIIGILGTLGTFGVRQYIGHAYAAEAVNTLGGIRRAAMLVAEIKGATAAPVPDEPAPAPPPPPPPPPEPPKKGGKGSKSGGTDSNDKKDDKDNSDDNNGAEVTHNVDGGLCSSADPVPAKFEKVKAAKYQPTAADYSSGSTTAGWTCLGFSVEMAQAYQYGYDLGGPKVSVELPHGGNPPGLDKGHTWTAWARGDRDGDGKVSWFVMTGAIVDGVVYAPPAVGMLNEAE